MRNDIFRALGGALVSGQLASNITNIRRQRQALEFAKQQAAENSAFRNRVFGANEAYRQQFTGPAALQNAESRGISARAQQRAAQTRADALLDETSGRKAGRVALQAQAGRAPLSQVPNILGTYNPELPQGGLTSPSAQAAFSAAQEAQTKQRIREEAGKSSVRNKEALKRQAALDTWQRLNNKAIGPKGSSTIVTPEAQAEFDRRQSVSGARQARESYKRMLQQEYGDDIEAIAQGLREYDAKFGTSPGQ